MENIKNVLVMGGGLMGKNIAFVVSSVKDYEITIYDINDVDVPAGIRQSTKQLVEKGIVSEAELAERLARIHFTRDLDSAGVKNADLVIEAVFEDMNLKRETFAKLEERCRPDCIFCTNTSVMSPTEISRDLKHRERFCGTHFWNPGHLIPLVEVVKTDATTDETAQTVMDFMTRIGKKPCLCNKDVPGFIANRLPQLSAMENADMVGLDLTYNIHEYVLPYIEDSHEPSPLLVKLKEEGKLGFKTGEGFQKWTNEEMEQVRDDLNTYLIRMLYGK